MITGNRKLDLERSFNRVMDRERERRELERCYSNYGSRKGSRRHSQNEELILEEVSIINNIEGRNKEEKVSKIAPHSMIHPIQDTLRYTSIYCQFL